MTYEQWLIVGILAAVMGGFVWGRWRYDVVALAGLVVAVATGLVPTDEAFAGFGHPATITVAAVLVISRGLANAGVVDYLARLVMPATRHPVLHIGALGGVAAALSAIMNNVAALALLMPVALQSAAKAKHSPAVILMPLSFASILGGLITLIGTPPNVIIASYRAAASDRPFGMFDFAPVGLTVAVVGLLFLTFVGWRLLPASRRSRMTAAELFDIENYVAEARVVEDSPAIGKTVSEIERESAEAEVMIVGLVRDRRRIYASAGRETVVPDDVLIIEAGPEGLDKFVTAMGLSLEGTDKEEGDESEADGDEEVSLRSGDVALVEAVLGPRARIIGRLAGDLNLRTRYGVNLLAVSRQGRPFRERVRRVRFQPGDVLLLQGDADRLPQVIASLGALPLAERNLQFGKRGQVWQCTGIFAAAIAAATLGLLPIAVSLTIAVVLLVLLDIVPARELYDGVDWPVIVLLAAMIPIGFAMQSTGATEVIADGLLSLTAGAPPAVVLTLLLVLTMTLSDIMNNAATTVVGAPIAITIASRLDVSADPFLMAVAVGASCAFLTPIGHQNNTLVLGPGGYRFSDFWRMGLPLEILIVLVAVPMILLIWPL